MILGSVLEHPLPAVHIEPAPLLVIGAPAATHGGDHAGRELIALFWSELQDLLGGHLHRSTFSRYDAGKSMNMGFDLRLRQTWTTSPPSYTHEIFPVRFL